MINRFFCGFSLLWTGHSKNCWEVIGSFANKNTFFFYALSPPSALISLQTGVMNYANRKLQSINSFDVLNAVCLVQVWRLLQNLQRFKGTQGREKRIN